MDELRKILRESKNKTYGTRLDGKGVESWVNSVNDLGTRANNHLTSEGYKKPDEELIKEIDSYLANHKDIDHYLRTNKAFYEDYDKAYQSYIDTVNNLRSLRNDLQSSNRVYSQWANEGEYNTWYEDYLKQQEEQKKYLEMINSEEASTGWQKYLDDVENAKKTEVQKKEDMPWWERLLGYYGTTGATDTSLPLGNMPQIINDLRNDTSYKKPKDNWSDEQRKQFGYLYSTDPNKAFEYAITVNDYNNKVAEEEALKEIAAASTSGFWAGFGNTVGAILTAPLGMADFLNDLAMANAGRPITSDGVISPFEYSQGVTSGISTHLNNRYGTIDEDIPIFGGKGWGDVYGLGTSIAQSLASAYTLGGAGTLISYFGQGAASGVDDALSRGATDVQAILYGTMLGAFEGLAEQFSVEKLLKAGSSATFKGFFKNVFNQMVAEGQEEGLTSLASNIADQWIMRDKSNFSILVEKYMAEGMSESEATKKACLDTIGDIAFDTITGAVSGSVSGGIHTTAQNVGANINAKEIYGSGADLVTEAHEIGGDAGLLADKYQGRLDKGKNLTGGQINRLVETNESTMVSQDTAKVKSAVESRLTKLGEKGDVSALADIITKAQTGGKLSNSERQILIDSKYGRRVSNELNASNIKSGEYSSAWAENIGTEKINVEAYNKGLEMMSPTKAHTSQVGAGGDEEKKVGKDTSVTSNAFVGKNTAIENGIDTVDGKEVSIKEIASIKDGVVTLRLEDGESVNASDVEFGSSAKGLLYENIVDMGLNAESANAFIRGYEQSEGLTAQEYVLGFREAYRYGEYGFPEQEMSTKGFSAMLSEEQKRNAYGLGKIDSKYKINVTQNAISKSKLTNRVDEGTKTIDEAMSEKGLTFRQKSSLKGLKVIAENLGLNIRIFESGKNEKGQRVGENGRYDPETGIMYIDLYAGLKGEGTILFTAAHELTHFIRQWSPAKFKLFADFLLEEYGKKGVSIDALVRNQIAKAKRKDRTIDWDTAYEEVIADSCESFLADGNAIEKIAKLKAKDKGLWQKIKDFITSLVKKIKAAYEGLSPDSIEGRFVSEMLDTAEKLKALWTDALMDASEAYSSAEKILSENGIDVDTNTESASLMSVRDLLDSKEQQRVAEALATRFGVTVEEARGWISAETSLASLILNPKYSQYLDYTPDPNEVAIKQNADYPQGTVDFSPICAKRREFTSVMNNILRLFPNHVFAATDLAKIRTIMQEEGMTIPCGICYVEDRRQLDTIVAQNFIDSLKLYREGSKIRPDGKPFNANQLKGLSLIDGDSYTPSVYELVSLEGLNVLKEKNPNMAEAWVKFNNARGMQAVRLLANEAEYKRQILKYNKQTVKSKNDKGGLRVYSFSDAEMFHLIDIIQVITDSATVGLSLQGYTKVNEYARAVKDTGEKLNRSLIPKGELGYHIEDGKVVLDYDTVEGIDINHPDFFDNRDNPNVGNITIGVSDVQIRAAMVSDFVDQIIPFHTGQSEEVLGEKGIATWSNYKDFQTEKDIATGKVSDHQINIYTEVLQVLEKEGKPITKRSFVEKFLQVCKENNLTPRFSQFLNTNAKGEYVYTEGYHKMLVDFKTFAQTEVGEYLPQMPVKPIFDNEYMTKVLKDYVKSQKVKNAEVAESMPRVIERITDEIVNPRKEVKLSDRDTSYMDAVIRGDMETAQRMVEEAAKEAGYPVKAFHGTNHFGFTETYVSKSDDGISFFAVDTEETASTYSGKQKVKRIVDASKGISDEDIETIQRDISDLASDLAYYCSRTLGIRGWVDSDYFNTKLEDCFSELEKGISSADAIDEFDEFCDELFYSFLDNYYYGNYENNPYLEEDEKITWDAFEGSEEADKLADEFYSYVNQITSKFKTLDLSSRAGIYSLYANTDNHLVIEGNGRMWDKLVTDNLPDIKSSDYEKYGYRGHRYEWTTRSVAAYAKDSGYSGVTFKNIIDSGDGSYVRPATVYIFFNPQVQVKSADPVTYDDNGDVIPLSERFNTKNGDIRYSERDYPIDADVEKKITDAFKKSGSSMHELGVITSEQNSAINRLVNQTNNDLYRGKFTGGKHRFSDDAIKHIIREHGDFLREGLRAQLPMTIKDIARHLSAIKANKKPTSTKASKTSRGTPSILTSYEVNGYTLYAEEITKSLGRNLPSDLIGHTMYKAPTLATAAFYATSAQTQPKRQSTVLCNYHTTNSKDLSIGNFVKNSENLPALLNYISVNGVAKQDPNTSGLIALSSDKSNFTDKSGKVEQGYVRCNKPFYITADNRVFSNSDTNVSEKINELKKQGYDCFIFEQSEGDNYMVAVVNKAQIVKNEPTVITNNGKDLHSDRDYGGVSNRTLLANALESVAKEGEERNLLRNYQTNLRLIDAEQAKLEEVKKKANEIRFTKGRTPEETKKMRDLDFEARQIATRINSYDRQLLKIEAMESIKKVLEREKQMAYKRAEQRGKDAVAKQKEKDAETIRALMTRYQESRKKGIEGRSKTELRHKIKNVVNELNQYLLKGTKDRHVPIELQLAVAEALDAVNMDTVGAADRVAKLKEELVKAKTPEKMQEIAKKIEHIQEMGDKMDSKLKALKEAYDMFIESDDPLIANSHDEVISNSIAKVIKDVGSTPLRDMTLTQLEEVYDLYRMVLTSVRNANKAFKAKKSESIAVLGNRVMEEVLNVGGKIRLRSKARQTIENFNWTNQKPIYAFERIGSDTFTEVYKNVRAGEDTWAVDMSEAKQFRIEQYEKHHYDSWDFDKRWKFTSTSGLEFELSLDQIMSLYAYSKREQAEEHLRRGGIVFDPKTEVVEKTKTGIKVKYNLSEATPYNLSDETLADIINKLTPEQRAFVDEMQTYLSDVMGEKGNEISLELYGIKMFKEKNYFPLKSATQFMERAKEQAQGEAKIKNKGFTKETAPKASNPIVLTSFMDVWADHVNEMSMYHAFVLPMEDFYRVYNYKTPTSDTMVTESVNMYIQNAYGEAAIKYIDQLLKDLNGGARTDPREGIGKKLITNFKKASVLASLSVVVQQPTAIVRAMALVDARHFGIAPISRGIVRTVNAKKHKELWAEVKKYAPVAIIKEMGYFDTNMGQSSKDFLLAKEYHGIREKAKALVTDSNYRDEKLMKLPALADEMAWVAIWEAVKRETVAKHKDLRPNSDEFLKVVGERFTEVVTKTQVYDSVLSRSGFMRSKSALVNMWTSFMGEATTSLNMIQDAILKGARGNKKYMAKAFGGVLGSVVLNAALVSLVYAMRDDDEDETYLEKYLARLSTELVDGINTLTYIPFVKDIWSILQGFDVERADMSLITDLVDSLQQTVKVMAKDTEDMDEEELAEYEKQVADSLWSIADTISSFLGLPVKNIRRDVNGAFNLFETLAKDADGRDTSFGSLLDEVWEDLKDSLPVIGWLPGESKTDKLYNAIISGDSDYVERFKESYKDERAYNSALSKALRDNDPRIEEAAQADIDGDVSKYDRIISEILDEGYFSEENIKAAIRAEINKLKPEEDEDNGEQKKQSIYESKHYYMAITDGNSSLASKIREDIIETAMANGKSRDDAEESFESSFRSYCRDEFAEGNLSRSNAMNMLAGYGGMENDEAYWEMKKWDYYVANDTYDGYSKYTEFYDAVKTGRNIKAVIKEYTEHGVKTTTLASQITSYYKPIYREMSKSERASLKGYLLNAYTLLGYNRADKSKDIDKWLED